MVVHRQKTPGIVGLYDMLQRGSAALSICPLFCLLGLIFLVFLRLELKPHFIEACPIV